MNHKSASWLVAAAVAGVLLGGCGDSSGPGKPYEQFAIAGHDIRQFGMDYNQYFPFAAFSVEGSIQVTDAAGRPVEGASLDLELSLGSVSYSSVTDGAGNADFSWSGTVAAPGYGSDVAVLSACASNSPRRCDSYTTILTITY